MNVRGVRKSNRPVLLVGLGLVLLALVLGFGKQVYDRIQPQAVPAQSSVPIQSLGSFTENFVKVELVLERDVQGHLILAGTYSPLKPDHHLYSKDLPRKGIEGAGRPTLLEIEGGALRAAGPLAADQPVTDHPVEGFLAPFPIYPDGPVTLRLPVEKVGSGVGPLQTRVSVTYMACSSRGRCLPPVVNRQVTIMIPGDVKDR